MRILIPAVLLFAAAAGFGSITYSQDAGGSIVEWELIEGSYTSLVLRASEVPCDMEDPDWGFDVATVMPDEEGIFPTSMQLPAAFIVDTDKCIADNICVGQCLQGPFQWIPQGKLLSILTHVSHAVSAQPYVP